MADETTTPIETDVTKAPVVDGTPETPETPTTEDAPETHETATTPETPAKDAAPVVPETYDLKLPDGVEVDPSFIERTAAKARTLGLTNEGGQKLLEADIAEAQAREAAHDKAWAPGTGTEWLARDAAWKQAVLADPELGGNPIKRAATVNTANLVLSKYFDASVAEWLKDSGLGSHPEIIRGLARLGRGMSEGSLVLSPQTDTSPPKTLVERMYENNGEGPKKKTA